LTCSTAYPRKLVVTAQDTRDRSGNDLMDSTTPDPSTGIQITRSRPMIFEDIDSLSDATLVITTTSSDQITARRIHTGERTLTVMGCQSDATQQIISQNHSHTVSNLTPQAQASQGPSSAAQSSKSFQGSGRTVAGP
jgi:hypothetical protein